MNVLVVDDSAAMRRIINNSLTQLIPGVSITEAVDGAEGLDKYQADSNFDLILLDWNMPNMTGIELLEKLKELDTQSKIIMVTTESEKANVVRAITTGANNYITKPFAPDVFRDKIKKVMEI